jgi:hypothetical protein
MILKSGLALGADPAERRGNYIGTSCAALADIEAFRKLERRFRCSDCGERAVSFNAPMNLPSFDDK